MGLKRSIIFWAGIVCILLISCNNLFHLIASLGEEEPNGEYIVRFDKNGGDIDADPLTMIAQAPTYTVMLPNDEPTWETYIFTGWNTAEDGSGMEFTRNTTVKANITVYAQWLDLPPGSYVVTFNKSNTDANSHEASPQKKAVISPNTTIDALPSEPIRVGHYFIGWNTNLDRSGSEFDETTPVNGTITVYAQWEPYKCIVTFDKNGGDTEANPLTKTVVYPATKIGELLPPPTNAGELPTPPTRADFNFIGWKDGSGTVFTEDTPVGILENKTLTVYAQWAEKTYTISGTITKSDGGVAVGATVELLLNGNRVDLVTADAQGKYTFSDVLSRDNYTIQVSLTGYSPETTTFNMPKRDEIKDFVLEKLCSVTFNTDGGSPVGTQYVKSGVAATRPVNPTKTGYTFDNWYTASDAVYNFTTLVTGDIMLYAKWTPINYTVTFDTNGGNGGGPMQPQPFVYGVAQNLTTNTFTRTGYTFEGWATTSTGVLTYTDGQRLSNLAATQGATVPLFAKWKAISYTVAYNANGGSGNMAPSTHTYDEEKALTANTFTRTGHAFVGWKDGSGIDYTDGQRVKNLTTENNGTVTLLAQWTEAKTVTFNKNNTDVGSTEANPRTKPVISPATNVGSLPTEPTRPGYDFSSWNTDPNGSGATFIAATPVTADIEVFAQWTVATYTITYLDVDGGTFSGTHLTPPPSPTAHTYGTATTLGNATKPNYTFGGWFIDSNGGGAPLTILSATGYTDNIILHAKWTGNVYPITYKDANGDSFSGSHGANHPTTHTYGTPTPLVSPVEPAGKTFAGWFHDNGGSALTTLSATLYTGEIILYARWTAATYTVTFYGNAGTDTVGGLPNPITDLAYGATISKPSIEPTRTGYEFVDWYKETGGSNVWNFDIDTVTTNTPLYAKWSGISTPPEPDRISGTITLAGGTGKVENVVVQLYTYNVDLQKLELLGPPIKPNTIGEYLLPDVSEILYFITASLDGYVTAVETLTSATVFPVNLTLPLMGARGMQSVDLQQLLMQLMQSEGH